jgi:hypothetical protein
MLVDYFYYVNQRDSLCIHKIANLLKFSFLKHSYDKKRNLDLQVIEPMTGT